MTGVIPVRTRLGLTSDVPVRTRPLSVHAGFRIIAVSENAPGAHGDVPRTADVPRASGGSTRRQCSTDGFADEDCNQQLNPRIFAKLIPRFKGASGAGGLLLNTKASQEAACSRAPDAIVPDQEPESHDAGVSRFGENGLLLEAADVAEGHAGQVERSGMSGNAGIGSHLARADFSDEPEAVL